MKLPFQLTKSCLFILAVTFLFISCDENGPCIRGEGDVETRELQLDEFNGVYVNGSTKVYIERGAQQHVEVKGQPNILDELETEVSDGVWRIETDRCLRRHKTIEVYITIPELRYAEVNGSGSLVTEDTFEVQEFQARVSGSGDITARFDASKGISRISGSGNIRLNGNAALHNVSISGSGNLRAFGLDTRTTTVDISGSGEAEVTATETLDATISGSGKVYYQGSPTVNSRITGSGKVVKR
ncbi:head GIN domain-containing protein [Pontibacter vulgaris]|uniref:head GIN domain-containing protein n=1 Tax=Pontibacter vulgaris TaxID=2905679 RepID=UPI001FA6F047|nr:head GIN domain-containing protein [Pontibacter vulgaris]